MMLRGNKNNRLPIHPLWAMVKSLDFGLVCTVITTVAALSLDALKVWMPCLLHLFVNIVKDLLVVLYVNH